MRNAQHRGLSLPPHEGSPSGPVNQISPVATQSNSITASCLTRPSNQTASHRLRVFVFLPSANAQRTITVTERCRSPPTNGRRSTCLAALTKKLQSYPRTMTVASRPLPVRLNPQIRAIPTFDLYANALFPWSPFAISPDTRASLPTTLHDIPSATDAAQVPIRSE